MKYLKRKIKQKGLYLQATPRYDYKDGNLLVTYAVYIITKEEYDILKNITVPKGTLVKFPKIGVGNWND